MMANEEIVEGTDFDKVPWEELNFKLERLPSFHLNKEKSVQTLHGLAIEIDEDGNIFQMADTKSQETYTITSLDDLYTRLAPPKVLHNPYNKTKDPYSLETLNSFLHDQKQAQNKTLAISTRFCVYEYSDMDCIIKLLPFEAAETLAVKRYVNIKGYTDVKGKVITDSLQVWFTSPKNTKLTISRNNVSIKIWALKNHAPAEDIDAAEKKYNIPSRDDLENESDNEGLNTAFRYQRLAYHIVDKLSPGFIDKDNIQLSGSAVWTNADLDEAGHKVDRSTIPYVVTEMYYKGNHAPWIETFKKGYFPNAYDYDINKAYPWALGELINIDAYHGDWIESQAYQPNAHYGITKCRINLDFNEVCPIFLRLGDWIGNVAGEFIEHLTKGEIDHIKKHRCGTVEILYGYWFIPNTKLEYPFKTLIDRLLLQQSKAEKNNNPLLFTNSRRKYTSMTGKLNQKTLNTETGMWNVGPFFNPIYYSEVTTAVKLRVAEAAILNANKVISISTDGLLLDGPIKGISTSPNIPGEFKLEHEGPAVVISANIAQMLRKRSFYALFDAIFDSPHNSKYKFPTEKRTTLCQAFKGKNLSRIGRLETDYVAVNIRTEVKRFWPELPFTGKELLDSQFDSQVLTVEEAMIHSKLGINNAEDVLKVLTKKEIDQGIEKSKNSSHLFVEESR